MSASAMTRSRARRFAGTVRAWAIAILVAVASLLAIGDMTSVVSEPVAAAQDEAAASGASAGAVCAVDLDSDKDTADREFTSQPAVWLAFGAGAKAPGVVRLMTPQFAAPPPQRPPRLAA